MAFKRFGRKRMGKKRQYRKRFNRRGNVRISKRGNYKHLFKRTAIDTIDVNLTAGFLASSGTRNEYQFSKIPGYTEFNGGATPANSMYDMYKLCGVRVKFVFEKNDASVATSNSVLPNLITINDFNNSTALASETEAIQYRSFKTRRMDKPISRYFRPWQLSGASNQPVKSRYNTLVGGEAINHYGLKFAFTGSVSAVSLGNCKIYTTYYFSMKDPM